nr:hypothetical protein BaRGS_008746 [Batillaria attramentaria]
MWTLLAAVVAVLAVGAKAGDGCYKYYDHASKYNLDYIANSYPWDEVNQAMNKNPQLSQVLATGTRPYVPKPYVPQPRPHVPQPKPYHKPNPAPYYPPQKPVVQNPKPGLRHWEDLRQEGTTQYDPWRPQQTAYSGRYKRGVTYNLGKVEQISLYLPYQCSCKNFKC